KCGTLYTTSAFLNSHRLLTLFNFEATKYTNTHTLMEDIDKNGEDELLSSLPKIKAWRYSTLYNYQGFWYIPGAVHAVASCQRHFEAQNTDTIIATFPKTGTTWLKALAFAILTRAQYPPSQSSLLSSNPHELVPFLELKLYINNQIPDDMEHNKTGQSILDFENKTLFRRAEIGGWINLLTPEMVERLTNVMEQKLAGSGLVFKIRPQ
ncbi:hypothetical protein Tsubulata_027606, partial [Turnera subulata]